MNFSKNRFPILKSFSKNIFHREIEGEIFTKKNWSKYDGKLISIYYPSENIFSATTNDIITSISYKRLDLIKSVKPQMGCILFSSMLSKRFHDYLSIVSRQTGIDRPFIERGFNYMDTMRITSVLYHWNGSQISISVVVSAQDYPLDNSLSAFSLDYKEVSSRDSLMALIIDFLIIKDLTEPIIKIIQGHSSTTPSKLKIDGDKFTSETPNKIEIINENYFIKTIRVNGFGVRGHFRFQPYKSKRNPEYKLVYLAINGKPEKSRFPDVYDREFERGLEGETLSAYWQHLIKCGWKKTDGVWMKVNY